MSKTLMRYVSETMNSCRDTDEDSIRTCVAMDAEVSKAIADYMARKNAPSQAKGPDRTFSLDDLKKDMMRPMIDYGQQIADIEKYASEQSDVEPKSHDEGIDR